MDPLEFVRIKDRIQNKKKNFNFQNNYSKNDQPFNRINSQNNGPRKDSLPMI